MMKINIYYGGRGLIDDSTIYVMNKITEVLEELRVEVCRYNLYEDKQGISTLPRTLKDCDGVILAANIEWFGIGGYLQQFLDACWLYGDKEKIRTLYMMPVVISQVYGEREQELSLLRAWELLGGPTCRGICAYVRNHAAFETNPHYTYLIEKVAEALYRTINQKPEGFPSSMGTLQESMVRKQPIELTPQETEQLSVYVSNDTYVKKQKEDIEELTLMFKELLGDDTVAEELLPAFKEHFKPMDNLEASYAITIEDANHTLVIEVKGKKLNCYYGNLENADVSARTTYEVMKSIIEGKTTFQGAFMSGALSAKGDFKTLRTFDTLFHFE
jgi:putative sterol carrier protein/multimeric flavodoxin WrbA